MCDVCDASSRIIQLAFNAMHLSELQFRSHQFNSIQTIQNVTFISIHKMSIQGGATGQTCVCERCMLHCQGEFPIIHIEKMRTIQKHDVM